MPERARCDQEFLRGTGDRGLLQSIGVQKSAAESGQTSQWPTEPPGCARTSTVRTCSSVVGRVVWWTGWTPSKDSRWSGSEKSRGHQLYRLSGGMAAGGRGAVAPLGRNERFSQDVPASHKLREFYMTVRRRQRPQPKLSSIRSTGRPSRHRTLPSLAAAAAVSAGIGFAAGHYVSSRKAKQEVFKLMQKSAEQAEEIGIVHKAFESERGRNLGLSPWRQQKMKQLRDPDSKIVGEPT